MVDPTSTPLALDPPEVPPDPWQLVGTDFDGGITVEAVVGVGGFGTVYRAYHRHFRAPVALKVLRCSDGLTAAQRRDLLQRFEQETVVLFRLSRLTLDVASCLAAGTFLSKTGDTTPYIVQEWLDGDSLDHLLKNEGGRRRYGLHAALALLAGPLRALLVAHEQGVVHRDIKPSNILVMSRDGQLQSKLLDFGIAKLRAGVNEANAREVGKGEYGAIQTQGFRFLSVEYAAPEQWDESLGAPSSRTDLFSLALVLVEMLCGKSALKGTNPHALMFAAMHPSERPTPRTHGADIPDELEGLFTSALAVRPEDRPASLGHWWASLQSAARVHDAWSAAPPRVTERLEETVLTPPGAVVFPDTGALRSVSSPAPPVVTGTSAPITRQLTSAFYDAGESLSREAARQRRRQIGLWITSTTVGAASVLAGATMWKVMRRERGPLQNVHSALTPTDAANGAQPTFEAMAIVAAADTVVDAPTSAIGGLATASGGAQPLQSAMESALVTPNADPLISATESVASLGGGETPASDAERGAQKSSLPRGSTRSARTSLAPSEAKAVAAFAPVSPGGAEVDRPAGTTTGELRLNSIPPSAIVIDGRPIGSTPKANVHLSPGSHNVTFVHPELGKRKLLVLVESGKSQTLSVKF